jgi:glycosyltransferase involved in cell wall biosynthesis
MLQRNKISVIIAAYNEAPRIGSVLSVVAGHPLIDEVIVVNDGSSDETSEVVKRFGVRLIENETNIGKTASCKRGLESAKNDIIIFLDADLTGLTGKNIYDLAGPVLNGIADWTLSLRGNSAIHMKLLKVDCLSGERAARKELLLDPLIWSKPQIGYSMEVMMNEALLNRGAAFQSVNMPNLRIITKSGKVGFIRGWYGELRMVAQISRVIPLRRVLKQFFKMSYLNRKVKKIPS